MAVSGSPSSSSPASTVTVCAVCQLASVNVRLPGLTLRSVPVVPPTLTVTDSVGSESSTTV